MPEDSEESLLNNIPSCVFVQLEKREIKKIKNKHEGDLYL
jgi:hypothetical protein